MNFLRIGFFISFLFLFYNIFSQSDTSSSKSNIASPSSSNNIVAPDQANKTPPSYKELRAMVDAGQKERAIAIAKSVLTNQPDNFEIRLFLGIEAFNDKNYQEAQSQLEYILQKRPDAIDARLVLINTELTLKNYQKVLDLAEQGLKIDPTNAQLMQRKKIAEEALKQPATATSSPSQAATPAQTSVTQANELSAKPSAPSVTYKELQAMAKAGKKKEAIEKAKSAISKNPEDLDVRLFLGITALQDKKYQEAKEQLEYILKKSPKYLDARYSLINVELSQHNYKKAAQLASEGLKISPNDKELLARKHSAENPQPEASVNNATAATTPPNQNQLAPSSQTTAVRGEQVVPLVGGKAANQLRFSDMWDDVSDLNQWWHYSSISYLRQTPLGPVIGYVNYADKFHIGGVQYAAEAYPKISKNMYFDVYYAYAKAGPVFSRYRYLVEPYFNLPQGFEYSIGQRGSKSSGGAKIYTYTSSIGKYYKDYWVSLRGNYYIPLHSTSYTVNMRKFFNDDAYHYMGVVVGLGRAPDIADSNTNKIISDSATSFNGYAQFPIVKSLYMNLSASYVYDIYPNKFRKERILNGGLLWLF